MEEIDKGTDPGDRNYRDSIGKIEPYGVDHIPDVERHGRASSQFYVWFSGNLGLALLTLGFYPVFFGLSLPQAISSVFVGAAAGSLVMGLLSRMGSRLGVPQQIQARGPLGYFGNFLPVAYVNVFASVGWAAVNTILGAWALQALISMPFTVAAALVAAVQFVVALYGYNLIHAFNKVFAFIAGAIFVLISALALTHANWHLGVNPKAIYFVGEPGAWISSTGIIFSYLVAWFPFASDYSRYLPSDARTNNRAGIWTGLGNFVAVFWLGAIGTLVASFAGAFSPIDAIRHIAGGASGVALVGVIVTTWTQNAINIYGGGISLQTLRIPVSRSIAVALISGAALVLAIVVHTSIYGGYYNFILLTAYFIVPYTTVVILDYYFGGKWTPERIKGLYDRSKAIQLGFIAWLVGVAASIPFWSATVYQGSIAAAHPAWGDLTYYVGALASFVAYFVVTRLAPSLITRRNIAQETILAEATDINSIAE